VRVLTEEVNVYRQLEVYNTTLQHEFRSLRERRRQHSGKSKYDRFKFDLGSSEGMRERMMELGGSFGEPRAFVKAGRLRDGGLDSQDGSPDRRRGGHSRSEDLLSTFGSPPPRYASAFSVASLESSPSPSPPRRRPGDGDEGRQDAGREARAFKPPVDELKLVRSKILHGSPPEGGGHPRR
jgi:hypothetical protein